MLDWDGGGRAGGSLGRVLLDGDGGGERQYARELQRVPGQLCLRRERRQRQPELAHTPAAARSELRAEPGGRRLLAAPHVDHERARRAGQPREHHLLAEDAIAAGAAGDRTRATEAQAGRLLDGQAAPEQLAGAVLLLQAGQLLEPHGDGHARRAHCRLRRSMESQEPRRGQNGTKK